MKRALIDTNIYIEAMIGNQAIIQKLQQLDLIGISTVSVGELICGFKIGKSEKKKLAQLEQFLDSPRVMLYPLEYTTADFYGEIFIKLRKAGTPIPTNDMWISATALEHGLRIFTLDKHFQKVGALSFY